MSQKSRNLDVIEHILRYCNEITNTILRFGDGFEIFEKDFDYRNSISMSILQLGELSKRLSDNFKTTYKEIPWKQIQGMRNIFAHDYGSVDDLVIWNTAKYNIPELGSFCEEIIKNYNIVNEISISSDDM